MTVKLNVRKERVGDISNPRVIVLINGIPVNRSPDGLPYGCTTRWGVWNTLVYTDSDKWIKVYLNGEVKEVDINKLHRIGGAYFIDYYGVLCRVVPPTTPHGSWLQEV